nr:phosphotransferase family protein [uncultured Brevundimonas sp.]
MNGASPYVTERRVGEVFDRKIALRSGPRYAVKTDAEVRAALERLFTAHGFQDIAISDLRRMTGGASKEQFAFLLDHAASDQPERLVLRMDPYASAVDTCRGREAEMIQALADDLPVPSIRLVDRDGVHLGQPGMIMALVPGVSMPTQMAGRAVSGIGGSYGAIGERLAPQFTRHIAALHNLDFSTRSLELFDVPRANSTDAALWQVNAFARSWHDDRLEAAPILSLTERWLRENAPICESPCLVHGDYRMGNFLFTEPDGLITAVLDWELSHIGDFHEDLSYILRPRFGSVGPDGQLLVSGLMPKSVFLEQYEALSGRRIRNEVIAYYDVFSAWKAAVVVRASAVRAAHEGHNHQDLLLAWLATGTGNHLRELADIMDRL